MKDDIAIRVEHLSKKYWIGKQKEDSFRGVLSGLFNPGKKSGEEFMALEDVSFEIMKGEAVGIIGKNGAGKSTLLKILSKITRPTTGRIEINGRVASLLEVGTGFHPELTGRENIFLNGTILGMTHREVKSKFDEIVSFSGVEKFIDTPVKHYSSGMYVRLAFAVAAHLEPEILIIDEVLAVGDAEFQKKCLGKMKDVTSHGRTVLFVSHNLPSIQQLCSSGIFFKSGRLNYQGEIKSVVDKYLKTSTFYKNQILKSQGIVDAMFENTDPENHVFKFNESIKVKLKIAVTPEMKNRNTYVSIMVMNNQLHRIFTTECELKKFLGTEKNDIIETITTLPEKLLAPSGYFISAALHEPNIEMIDFEENILDFEIFDDGTDFIRYYGSHVGDIIVNCNWNAV